LQSQAVKVATCGSQHSVRSIYRLASTLATVCWPTQLLAWPTCPLNLLGFNLKAVAPQRLPQMHNGKIIIIAYKMLMGNGPRAGAEAQGPTVEMANVWRALKTF